MIYLSGSEAVVRRCSVKKGVLINFAKFTGKHLSQSFFFNKSADLRSATLLKKRLWHRCFPVNFAKFIRTPFFKKHLWWLLLQAFISKWSRLIIQVILSRFPLKPILSISFTCAISLRLLP